MFELKQSATDIFVPLLLVSSTNHIDGATGLTPAVTLSMNGGWFGGPAGTVLEIGYGWLPGRLSQRLEHEIDVIHIGCRG